MSGKQFECLVGSVSKQLVNELAEWQNENMNKMSHEDFGIVYANNVLKVLGGSMPREQLYSKVRRGLYKYLKMNPKVPYWHCVIFVCVYILFLYVTEPDTCPELSICPRFLKIYTV